MLLEAAKQRRMVTSEEGHEQAVIKAGVYQAGSMGMPPRTPMAIAAK